MASFQFDDNIQGDFIIVHEPSNMGVGGADTKANADIDAASRNARAKDLGLTCKYVVKPRSEGHGVTKAEYEQNQKAKKA